MHKGPVKLYKTNHKTSPYQVRVNIDGEPRRRHFKKLKDAEKLRDKWFEQIMDQGFEGFAFRAEARLEYIVCKRRLDPFDVSLYKAVDYYIEHHTEKEKGVLFDDALQEMLESKEKANRRERTINDIRKRLVKFKKHTFIDYVNQVTVENTREFINLHNSPRTKMGYRAVLSGFFRLCIRREWMKDNPLDRIDTPTLDNVEFKILTPEQVARCMTAAAKVDGGRACRNFALRFFAGLRPTEIKSLEESDIKKDIIRVGTGKKRGKRAVRIVPISDVLRGWLDITNDRPINHVGEIDTYRKIVLSAKLKTIWKNDLPRKTWISYRLAETKDEKAVAREAGNSPDVIYQHYFGLVEPVDVAKFGTYSFLPS